MHLFLRFDAYAPLFLLITLLDTYHIDTNRCISFLISLFGRIYSIIIFSHHTTYFLLTLSHLGAYAMLVGIPYVCHWSLECKRRLLETKS